LCLFSFFLSFPEIPYFLSLSLSLFLKITHTHTHTHSHELAPKKTIYYYWKKGSYILFVCW
jgi:hypothetical protein